MAGELDLGAHNGQQPFVVPGFRHKIAGGRFHGLTASLIVAHAVMTTIGNVLSISWIFRNDFEPFLPGGVFARVIQVQSSAARNLFFQGAKDAASDVTASV